MSANTGTYKQVQVQAQMNDGWSGHTQTNEGNSGNGQTRQVQTNEDGQPTHVSLAKTKQEQVGKSGQTGVGQWEQANGSRPTRAGKQEQANKSKQIGVGKLEQVNKSRPTRAGQHVILKVGEQQQQQQQQRIPPPPFLFIVFSFFTQWE